MKCHYRHPVKPAAVLLMLAAIAGGCAPRTPTEKLSLRFGQCFETAFSAQILHPDAPGDASPADRLPGDLADQIYQKRYVKSMIEEREEKADTSSELSGLD